MTTITIRIPDEGAIRLLEESIKAGVPPDRFVAMLIEERLKRSDAALGAPAEPSLPAPKSGAEPPQVPQLNKDGMKALERLFTNFGAPTPQPARKARKPKHKSSRAK